jgi:F0F1-type ATP synthase membrane subunit c/vacuolar-type H+-ATPase subunit K
MKLTQQNQGAFALILWIAFLNAQLMFFVVAMLKWRTDFPRVPLAEMKFWDATLMNGGVGLALLTLGSLLASVGLGLGIRYYSGLSATPAEEKPRSPTLLVLAFILLETLGILGLVFGLMNGNMALGLPFQAISFALFGALVPLSRRFPRASLKNRGGGFPPVR